MTRLTLLIFLIVETISAGGSATIDHHGLVGFTYTQDDFFVSRAQGSQIANIQIYGWGTLWPYSEGTEKEHDNGAVLDGRVRRSIADGQEVVLTCATAPSTYRKSGRPWNMQERVLNSMEEQYAMRCAQTVSRWRQITRVQVWNELKGYWLGPPENRWDYEGYTRFYNKVYHAVKAARPDVLVGGGYAVLTGGKHPYFDKQYDGVLIDSRAMDAMQYWVRYADGFDAICLDGTFAPNNFVKVTAYFRKLVPGKPIWWSEFYSDDNADMREAMRLIVDDQQPGDVALWWEEKRFGRFNLIQRGVPPALPGRE
jgi:hypothetical protein